MNSCVFTIKDIARLVKTIAEKYERKAIYLFGSYARGEADGDSDLDFLVFGGEDFKLTMVFALAPMQWLVAMPLYNIGEYVYNLSNEYKEAHNEIQWTMIAGLRHHLIHDYSSFKTRRLNNEI